MSNKRIPKSIDITVHSLEWLLSKHLFTLEESGNIKQYFDDIISEFEKYELEIAELKKSKKVVLDVKTIKSEPLGAYVNLKDLQAKDNLNNNLSSY